MVALAALAALIAAASSASQTGAASSNFSATALTPDSTYTADKSLSGRLARTDQSLLGVKSSKPVNVMIKYDFDPLRRTPAALPACAPRARGRPA